MGRHAYICRSRWPTLCIRNIYAICHPTTRIHSNKSKFNQVRNFNGTHQSLKSSASVPIYVFACIVTVVVGFTADRKGHRAFINMFMISIGIAGYIILAASRVPGLSYFAIYLSAAGIYPCIPNTVALTSTSIEGIYKRSVVMGWIISFGNINGAATTNA